MPKTTELAATQIEKAVYRCVATSNGGATTHKQIKEELELAFSSKHQVTRIMNGTTTISNEDLKLIKAVLVKWDSTITVDDLI